MTDEDPIVTIAEGAKRLGRHRATIFRWARKGLVDPVEFEPARFRLSDLVALDARMAETAGGRLRRGT